jgi:hypothetical protein
VINKDTLKWYAILFHYTQRSAFKAIIKKTMHQYLNKPTFVNVGAFTPFFEQFSLLYVIKKLLKFTKSCKNEYICKKSIKSQNRYQTRRDTPMCFGLGKTSEIFLRAMTPSWSAHGTLYPCLSYEKLPCALQDGVKWRRIFTSALVKFRTKYRLSDTSGPVSILWSNQEMFAISLSSCSRYNANFKLDQSVSAIHDSPPYFW